MILLSQDSVILSRGILKTLKIDLEKHRRCKSNALINVQEIIRHGLLETGFASALAETLMNSKIISSRNNIKNLINNSLIMNHMRRNHLKSLNLIKKLSS